MGNANSAEGPGGSRDRKDEFFKDHKQIKKPFSKQDGKDKKGSSAVGKTYIAYYDYAARSIKELSFRAQDKFEVIDCPDNHWWKVIALTNNHEGFIPSAYIVDSNSLLSKAWYFDKCKRREAESALVLNKNLEGSFLIRESETMKGQYSLSIKLGNTVKHYRIRYDKNKHFFVSKQKSFPTLESLADYYQQTCIGKTGVKLSEPCARELIYEPVTPSLAFSTIDQWELDRNQIYLEKEIGSGNFGEVYYGSWDGRVTVAVKTLKQGAMEPEAFMEEAIIMKKLFHKNLVQLLGVCTVGEPMYIVTEYMPNGSLQDYLRKNKDIEFHVLMNMAAQVASGMAYIEAKQYVHRDLAARNVLVGQNNIVKVADFGLSRLIDEGFYKTKSTLFPIKWTAPEACTHKLFTIKSDVWSFGILAYEIFTNGGEPYPNMTNNDALRSVLGGYRMPRPKGCEQYIYDVMLETWNKDPEARPTFETLQWKLDEHFTLDGSEYVQESVYE
ncbi:unnamed protein product, partial [Meganyctiphanes norvegica]